MNKLFALFLLVLSSPIILTSSFLIIIVDKQSPIFKQKRVGKYGRLFTLYKLQTMVSDHDGSLVMGNHDSRITTLGSILRKCKIDELPQLINLLKGDMQIVGYRPEIPRLFNNYPPYIKNSLYPLLPGITDPASIIYRDEATLLAGKPNHEEYYLSCIVPDKLGISLQYQQIRSIKTDIVIVCLTFFSFVIDQSKATNMIGRLMK